MKEGRSDYVRDILGRNGTSREIKTALARLFSSKCAYCETKTDITDDGQIDHFRPQRGADRLNGKVSPEHYIWLAADWDNLVYVCKRCNSMKRNIFPIRGASPIGASVKQLRRTEYAQLLDPCYDRPVRHLAVRSDGRLVPRTSKGATTIRVLDLNRSHLLQARKAALLELNDFLGSVDFSSVSDSRDQTLTHLLGRERPHVGFLYMFLWHFSRKEGRQVLQRIEEYGEVSFPSLTVLLRNLARPNFTHLDEAVYPDEAALSIDVSDPSADFRIQQRKLSAIVISNFKGIDNAEIVFNGSGHESGSGCDAIVGRNAMGKTSVLQAIALALMGAESANEIVPDARLFVKDGQASGSIIARFHDTDQQNHVIFERGRRNFTGETGVRSVVLGYGAYRILAKSELQSRHLDRTHRVKSLFGYNVRINGPHGWLAEVTKEARVDAVRTLNVLLEGNEVEAIHERGRLQLKTRDQRHRLSSLSSGFQSIVSLVMDILDVLYNHRDSVLASEAVVLVDELDAHLHPSWRLGIAQRLRKAFPAIHLIFSTHDPLTLRGLKRNDVQVLYRTDNGSIAVDDRESYTDSYDVDQLLTSDLFGLHSTRNAATEKAMQKYYDLLAVDGPLTRKEATERDALEAQLNSDTPGKSKRERLLMRIIDAEIALREQNRPAKEYDPEFVAHLQTLFRRAISDEEGAE